MDTINIQIHFAEDAFNIITYFSVVIYDQNVVQHIKTAFIYFLLSNKIMQTWASYIFLWIITLM